MKTDGRTTEADLFMDASLCNVADVYVFFCGRF